MDRSDPIAGFGTDDAKKLLHLLVARQAFTREEAEAAVHALLDIAESVEKVYREILPKILSNLDAPIEDLQELSWDIREEFRHIDYHIHDGKLLDL